MNRSAATELGHLRRRLGDNWDLAAIENRARRQADLAKSLRAKPGPKGPHGWDVARWNREYADAEAEIQRQESAGKRKRLGKRAVDSELMEIMSLESSTFYGYLQRWGRPT